jgi:hypothetical protein
MYQAAISNATTITCCMNSLVIITSLFAEGQNETNGGSNQQYYYHCYNCVSCFVHKNLHADLMQLNKRVFAELYTHFLLR